MIVTWYVKVELELYGSAFSFQSMIDGYGYLKEIVDIGLRSLSQFTTWPK